ncbi:ribonuclease H-like domain-containing protein [Tanacetum coccineum]|uniref:Ribonuclease H-like domain-containing protein n=1 Tax=Tanacetum coccineum TaxID=301880 RepID=A0ABQ4X9F7_9ASTR
MSGEEPATQIAPVESPQMVSTVKLPILKKGEYTLWSMRMEQYLTNTDYSLWQVILNGDVLLQVNNVKKVLKLKNRDAGYRSRDNTRRTVPVETSDALVVQDNALIVQDGLGYDWSYIAQDEPTEFALMAYTANSSGSDTESINFKDKYGMIWSSINGNDSSGSELFLFVYLIVVQVIGDDIKQMIRFKRIMGYHVVPPPLTGNYMPPLADLSFARLDDYVYRPTANKTSSIMSQGDTSTTQTSNTSVEMPRVESVRPSGVIIEDWVSDDEDIFQSNDLQATYKPSLKRIEFTNARNESVKSKQAEKPRIITQNPTVDRRDWNEKMTQKLGLGFGFTKKACFVCGSYSHLIKDCDFHEKIMAKKSVLKNMGKNTGNPQQALKKKGIFNSGCSRHMTGNKDFLIDYQELDGGFVAFSGSARGELKFNIFSVSQMCDKKNNVLFTETKCLVLSPDFKLLDESQVLLRVPRQSNMYNFDLKNVVPSGDLTCLFVKATIDESKLWHKRLGHVNFKTMNKLVKGNLVRGLPSKIFENDHTCVGCQKGKQHKASYKAKLMSSIRQPL